MAAVAVAMMFAGDDMELEDDAPSKPLPKPPKVEFKQTRSIRLSFLLIFVGLCCVVLEFVKLHYLDQCKVVRMLHSSTNIYMTSLLPITGIYGAVSSKLKKRWLIVILLYAIIPTLVVATVILVRNSFVVYYLSGDCSGVRESMNMVASTGSKEWSKWYDKNVTPCATNVTIYFTSSVAACVCQSIAILALSCLGYHAFIIFQVACSICRDNLGGNERD